MRVSQAKPWKILAEFYWHNYAETCEQRKSVFARIIDSSETLALLTIKFIFSLSEITILTSKSKLNYFEPIFKQENIRVGCLLPACSPYPMYLPWMQISVDAETPPPPDANPQMQSPLEADPPFVWPVVRAGKPTLWTDKRQLSCNTEGYNCLSRS